MALSKTTQDHDEIKAWAEERGGKPAEVAGTEGKDGAGIIRLEFPGAVHANDSNLAEISWDDFFAKFDASGLALVYQDVTADGEKSNFNRLIHPENASGGADSVTPPKKAGKSGSAKGSTAKKVEAPKSAKKSSTAKAPVAAKKAAPAKKAQASKSKSPVGKSPVKPTATKKAAAPAKKVLAKAAPPRKAPAEKVPAKKAPAPKAAAKKAVAKKGPAKKAGRR